MQQCFKINRRWVWKTKSKNKQKDLKESDSYKRQEKCNIYAIGFPKEENLSKKTRILENIPKKPQKVWKYTWKKNTLKLNKQTRGDQQDIL